MIENRLPVDSPLMPAEIRFLTAVRQNEKCDLSSGAEIVIADVAGWQDDRYIRSQLVDSVLRELSKDKPRGPLTRLEVRGAVIKGPLLELQGAEVAGIRFEGCRFDDDLFFTRAEFLGEVKFTDCHFRSRVSFANNKFHSYVSFSGSNFAAKASFAESEFTNSTTFEQAEFSDDVDFRKTSFHDIAWLTSCKFTGDASFYGTHFGSHVYLDRSHFGGKFTLFQGEVDGTLHLGGCTFVGDVAINSSKCAEGWFAYSNFLGKSSFSGSKFSDFTFFASCIFHDQVDFNSASFDGNVNFSSATFLATAKFRRTSFEEVSFENAVAREWDLSEATLHTGDFGPIIGLDVKLTKVILKMRGRLVVAASAIEAPWLTAQSGIHLVFRAGSVTLNDSEFAKRSILSSHEIDDINKLRDVPIADTTSEVVSSERVEAELKAQEFRAEVFRTVNSLPLKCAVESLERSNVSELVLADVVLDRCRFMGSHGLDKLRMASSCSFQWTPYWWGWKNFAPRRMYTRRRLLYEELLWRRDSHSNHLPSPLEISSIYRDLRKSLEDARNEPAAADFYYGEMEMRRLSKGVISPITGKVKRGAPFVERTLLAVYCALSGYGLRASRALIALALLIVASSFLFTHNEFATSSHGEEQIESVDLATGSVRYSQGPPSTAPDFPAAAEFAARESLSLLQSRSANPEITTRGFGIPLDFMLRLGGPALLALAVLAVRGRTKR